MFNLYTLRTGFENHTYWEYCGSYPELRLAKEAMRRVPYLDNIEGFSIRYEYSYSKQYNYNKDYVVDRSVIYDDI